VQESVFRTAEDNRREGAEEVLVSRSHILCQRTSQTSKKVMDCMATIKANCHEIPAVLRVNYNFIAGHCRRGSSCNLQACVVRFPLFHVTNSSTGTPVLKDMNIPQTRKNWTSVLLRQIGSKEEDHKIHTRFLTNKSFRKFSKYEKTVVVQHKLLD
jgi:hypothetical protein